MNSLIIIIVIVSLIAFRLIIYSIVKKKSKKTKFLFKKLQAFGTSKDLNFSEYETWGKKAIGIDKKSQCVLFLNETEQGDVLEQIDLQKVRVCEVNKVSTTFENYTGINNIDLRIIFKESKTSHLLLTFYTVKDQLQLCDELQLAEKWAKIINSSLN
jgi:hypothetical protein